MEVRAAHQKYQNPFPGLRSFGSEEAHLFFGREEQIDELLVRLGDSRFLAVVGSSGSGKSSLVRAGLLPALYSGFMTAAGSTWETIIFRPGDDPFANLADALNSPKVLNIQERQPRDIQNTIIKSQLMSSSKGLINILKQGKLRENDNLLIVIDQFEEIFRYKQKEAEDDGNAKNSLAFVNTFLESVYQSDLQIFVVITMRSDFLGNCTEFPGLVEAINKGQYLIPRMTREQQKIAVIGPVAVSGATISNNLIMRMLNDVGEDPDHLPIMQHALMRTWDYWFKQNKISEPINLHHYEAIGTMSSALSIHAEEAFLELQTEKQKKIAEVMFKSLTEKSIDGKGTRRPSPISDIIKLTKASFTEICGVADVFRTTGRSFLMPTLESKLTENSIIDISHESIMRLWDRLRRWVDEETISVQTYLRLCDSAKLYQEGKLGLMRDPELELTLLWYKQQLPNYDWASRYNMAFETAMVYLEHSRKERDFEIIQKEKAQKRRLQRARFVAIFLGTSSLISLLFLIFAIISRIEAEGKEREALEQSKKAEISREEAERQKERALMSEQEALTQKEKAILSQQEALIQKERAVRSEADAVEQKEIAVINSLEAIRQKGVADLARAQAESNQRAADSARALAVIQKNLADVARNRADSLRIVALAKNLALQAERYEKEGEPETAGKLALQSYLLNKKFGGQADDANIFEALFTTRHGLEKRGTSLIGHKEEVRTLALSPNGDLMLSGSIDGVIKGWNPKNNTEVFEIKNCKDGNCGVRDIQFSTNGKLFFVAMENGVINVWETGKYKKPLAEILGHENIIRAISITPNGEKLISISLDGIGHIWNLKTDNQSIGTIKIANSRFSSLTISQDGNTAYIGTEDGSVIAWDINTKQYQSVISLTGKVLSVSVSPDGNLLAVGLSDGKVKIYDLKNNFSEKKTLRDHSAGVNVIAFDSDGKQFATGSADKTVKVYSLSNLSQAPYTLKKDYGWIFTLFFSSDNERVIFGSSDKKIHFSETSPETLASKICKLAGGSFLSPIIWEELTNNTVQQENTCK